MITTIMLIVIVAGSIALLGLFVAAWLGKPEKWFDS